MKAWKGMKLLALILQFQNEELAFLGLVSAVIALPLSSNPGHLNIHQYFSCFSLSHSLNHPWSLVSRFGLF